MGMRCGACNTDFADHHTLMLHSAYCVAAKEQLQQASFNGNAFNDRLNALSGSAPKVHSAIQAYTKALDDKLPLYECQALYEQICEALGGLSEGHVEELAVIAPEVIDENLSRFAMMGLVYKTLRSILMPEKEGF